MLPLENWRGGEAVSLDKWTSDGAAHRQGAVPGCDRVVQSAGLSRLLVAREAVEHLSPRTSHLRRRLQTWDHQPARYLPSTDSLCSVAAGKIADLVVLDADPLVDIHNTQRVHAVVLGGRLIDPVERERWLSEGRQQASGR